MKNSPRNSTPSRAPLMVLIVGPWLAVLVAAIPADLNGRREYVRNLPIADQQQLLRNLDRFAELPAAEQQKLRDLHVAIERHPQADRLRETLDRYHEWLKTLRPEDRAELLELDAAARLTRVKELLAKQREEYDRRRPAPFVLEHPLTPEDQRVVGKWLSDLVWSQRETLLADVPSERRQQLESHSESQQRRELAFYLYQKFRNGQHVLPPAQVAKLVPQLSRNAQQAYEGKSSSADRERMVKQWIVQSAFMRFSPGSMRRGWSHVSAEELERFMKQDLPPDERQRLLELPREQLQDELRQLYLRRMHRDEGPRSGRPDRPPFARPGPNGPRPLEEREFGPGPRSGDGFEGGPPRHRPRPDRPDGFPPGPPPEKPPQ